MSQKSFGLLTLEKNFPVRQVSYKSIRYKVGVEEESYCSQKDKYTKENQIVRSEVYITGDRLQGFSDFYYDERGQLVKSYSTPYRDGKYYSTIYIYDAGGNLIEELSFSNDVLNERRINLIDNQGRKTGSKRFDANNNPIRSYLQELDSNGNLLISRSYYKDIPESILRYEYDANNRLIKDTNEPLIKSAFSHEYATLYRYYGDSDLQSAATIYRDDALLYEHRYSYYDFGKIKKLETLSFSNGSAKKEVKNFSYDQNKNRVLIEKYLEDILFEKEHFLIEYY